VLDRSVVSSALFVVLTLLSTEAAGQVATEENDFALPRPWKKEFGGCVYSGDLNGAPLLRSGECPTASGELNLNNLGITVLPALSFAGISNITALYLSKNEIAVLPPDIFKGLTGKPKLTCFTSTKVQMLTLTRLPAITTLHLDNNKLKELQRGIFSGTMTAGIRFTCFASTKVLILTHAPRSRTLQRIAQFTCFYWYKSTNTDAVGATDSPYSILREIRLENNNITVCQLRQYLYFCTSKSSKLSSWSSGVDGRVF
jgi:Leucine-rich repeat (LRR) protein